MVTLKIDHKDITVPAGVTILEAARSAGISIPTLCYHNRMNPIGSCRMCVVEVEGCTKPMAACTTHVTEGISVITDSERLNRIRRDSLKLMLVNHPLDCPVCDKGGACTLQNLVYEFGIDTVEYTAQKRELTTTYATPLVRHWPDRCVMCLRCVTACREITGISAIELEGKGYDSHIVSVRSESCESCGECLSVCPVGALTEKVSRYKGRPWLVDRVMTTCAFCSCGCQLELNLMNKRVIGVTSRDGHGSNRGSLCVKGRFGYEFIGSERRLTRPLVKRAGVLEEADWNEALGRIVQGLRRAQETGGAESIGGICSDRLANEEVYLFQKFMRAVLGTNNVDHAGGFSYGGMLSSLGSIPGYRERGVTLDDIEKADVIFLLRSHLSDTHPVAGYRVNAAVSRAEAQLIVASSNPGKLKLPATLTLTHKPGEEAALLNAVMQVIIGDALYREETVTAFDGFEELKGSLTGHGEGSFQEAAGAGKDQIDEAALLLSRGTRVCILIASGLGILADDTNLVRSLANLSLLIDLPGREGSGIGFLGEKANSQGALDMGAVPHLLPGDQDPSDAAVRDLFEKTWEVSLPSKPGLNALEMLTGAERGDIKALYLAGENPLITYPDASQTKRALDSLDFLVVQDLFLTPTAASADVVLPAASFAEKNGTYTSFERRVHRLNGGLRPLEGSRTDLDILCALSRAFGYEMTVSEPAEVMAEIGKLVPLYQGVDYALPVEGQVLRYPDGEGGTASRAKTRFVPVAVTGGGRGQEDEYPLVLITGCVSAHSGSLSTNSPALNQVAPANWVEVHPEDAGVCQLEDGQEVLVESKKGEVRLTLRISKQQMKGTVFIPYHFSEQPVHRLTSKDLSTTRVRLHKA